MYNMERLKELRKEKGYTIYKMAELLDIAPSYYSQLENKKRRLYYETAIRIARIFNMNPDQIFLNKKNS